MRIIRITRNRVSARALAEAEAVLRAGGVVAFPTETAYGLAADPTNAKAVAKVFRIKGRDAKKALPLVAADAATAARRFAMRGLAARLAERYWPGAFTIALPIRASSHVVSRGSDGTAAVRVPASAWARAIAAAAGGLATSTSANRAGEPNCYSGRAVAAAFAGVHVAPDLLLDAGALPSRKPSTIVRIVGSGPRAAVEVLRQGSVRYNEPRR